MKKFTTIGRYKFFFIAIALVTSFIIYRDKYYYIQEQKIQTSIIKVVPVKVLKQINDTTFNDVVNTEQQNPDLIAYIKNKVILPPSGKPYNLSNPNVVDSSQSKQGTFLIEYFKEKKFGTFIEAGALDGEYLSNTLILERQLGWTGLLIEPNPKSFARLSSKHRNAHITSSCISLTTSPNTVEISLSEANSKIVDSSSGKKKKTKKKGKSVRVNCFPLYSMMAAVNITTVDLISLDVESFEVKMLKTIPWDDVDIKTLLIEANIIPEGKEFLKKFMFERNYTLKKILSIDYFFVKNS